MRIDEDSIANARYGAAQSRRLLVGGLPIIKKQ